MQTLIGVGHFTWDAAERRSDRYGTVRLKSISGLNDDEPNEDVLISQEIVESIEGKKGKLFAKVLEPVVSPHCGDLARKIFTITPSVGDIVELGVGELFIDQNGIGKHEPSELQMQDKKDMQNLLNAMMQGFMKFGEKTGAKVTVNAPVFSNDEVERYDAIGLRPDDGRETDWLNPQSFFRLHLSKIELYFEY